MSRFRRIFTFKRFIYYGFPVYLVLAEFAIRFLLSYAPGKKEDIAIVASASTVAAAGLSLIAPVLIPKPMELDAATALLLTQKRGTMIGDLDLILIVFAYVALLFLPFAWGWALWMAHQENVDYNILMFGAHLPGPFLVGLAIYVVGMICTELKEVV